MREQEQFIEWMVNNKAYRIDKYSIVPSENQEKRIGEILSKPIAKSHP